MKQLSPLASLLILSACCAAFVAGALFIYKPNRPQTNPHAPKEIAEIPSPSGVADSPLSLDSELVGSEACGECHAGILASYKKHPMYFGSTRLVANDASPPPDSAELKGNLKTLFAKSSEGRMSHVETAYDLLGREIFSTQHEMKYVVGSGRRAKAYLEQRETMLCLSPLNWFGKTGSWGLNPGYTIDDPRGFDRKALANCLLCHTGTIRTQSPKSDFYLSEPFGEHAIGCERCHGAGKGHIAFHKQKSPGHDPIVNPELLDESARQAVCYQCHLQPSASRILREGKTHQDFQPGMRLDDVWLVLDTESGIGSDGRTKSVRHVQQMHDSQCFKKSGSMRCTTCHDPHATPSPSDRISFYRDACTQCHAPTQSKMGATVCSESSQRRNLVQDSCFECHMPRRDLDLSSHASQSDHRIIRNLENEVTESAPPQTDPRFFGELADSISEDSKRRAKAIYQIRNYGPSATLYREFRTLSEKFPNDGLTQLSYGLAAMSQNDIKAAVTAWTKAADYEESKEFALEALHQICQRNAEWDNAIVFAERLIKANPYHPAAYPQLANALWRINRVEDSIQAAKRGLELDPLSLLAYQVLIEASRAQGNEKAASAWQAERDRIAEKLSQTR